MKRLLSGLAAASLLIGLPLAAAADDRDHDRRGWDRHGHYGHHGHHGHWHKPRHGYYHHYHRPAPAVVYYPAPAPYVVYRPVYVPAPVVHYPPVFEGPRVSIGFRVHF